MTDKRFHIEAMSDAHEIGAWTTIEEYGDRLTCEIQAKALVNAKGLNQAMYNKRAGGGSIIATRVLDTKLGDKVVAEYKGAK